MTLTATLTKARLNIERDREDIRRGSTLSLLGFIARLGARVPFLLIAGRLYGTESYGEYVLLTAIVESIALLSSFGLRRTLFRCIDATPGQASLVIRHAVFIASCLSILLMATIQLFASSALLFFSAAPIADMLVVLACAIPFISLTDVFLTATLSRRIIRHEVVVRSFIEPITLTVLSLLFFLMGYSESGLIYAFVFAFGFSACFAGFQCYRTFGRAVFCGGFQKLQFTSILQHSSYTCLHDVTRVLMTRLDTFAVGYFFSTTAVGVYGMAQQFLTIVEKIALSLYPMLMPVVSDAVSTGDRDRLFAQLKSAGVRLVLLQFPVIATFFLIGKDLLAFIGEEFVPAWPVLMILSVGCWVNAVLQLVEVPLTYIGPHINLIGCLGAIGIYLLTVSYMQSVLSVEGIALTSVLSTFMASITLTRVFLMSSVTPPPKSNT